MEYQGVERGIYPSAWKRNLQADVCPYGVINKRCKRGHANRQCVCTDYGLNIMDHAKRWKDITTGGVVITCEPYYVDGESLARFLAQMAEIGVHVAIHGGSPHNPGCTVMIELTDGRQ